MTEQIKTRRTGAQMAGAVLIGLAIGALSPYMLLLPLVFVAPVLDARLYAYAGAWPVAVSCAAQAVSSLLVLGSVPALMVLAGMIAPLLVTVWLLRTPRRTLGELVRLLIPVWMLAALLAVGLGNVAAGMNLADYLSEKLRQQLEVLPVALLDQLLAVFQGTSLPNLTLETLTHGFLDAVSREQGVKQMVSWARDLVAVLLPGTLLSAAAVTAIAAAAWPCRYMARRDPAWKRSWQEVRVWHLPASVTLGMLGLFVLSRFFVDNAQMAGACAAVEMLFSTSFQIQAVGSAERALSTTAMRPGARAAVIVAALALTSLGSIATYYGLASALFGSHYGLVTTYLRKRRDNGTDDD